MDRDFPVAQMVKNLPAMQEIWVQSLDREDPLEKGMATHFQYSCLKNPTDRRAWWATVRGMAELDMTEQMNTNTVYLPCLSGTK